MDEYSQEKDNNKKILHDRCILVAIMTNRTLCDKKNKNSKSI